MISNHNFLFDPLYIKAEIKKLNIDNLEDKIRIVKNWISKRNAIINQTERQLQPVFFTDIFCEVLGYNAINSNESVWNMEFEISTELDSSTPDAILGFYNADSSRSTKAVVELKGPTVKLDVNQKRANKNYGTPVEQGYAYAPKFDGCEWIIVTNIYEIRLYRNGISQHYFERFILSELVENIDEFKRFYFLLNKDNLLSVKGKSKVDQLSDSTYKQRKKITDDFYKYYKDTRLKLWKTLVKNNEDYDEEILLSKAQKILDRITFIRFCEDQILLPSNILKTYIEEGEESKNVTIWTYLQTLFRYIDRGDREHNINKFNGELFKHDSELDYLDIPDKEFSVIKGFYEYNFNTELDVNILGHIFEQSISDIEELKGQKKQTGKRKKDGVFYTPGYVTQYIVNNSIGKWLEDKKEQLNLEQLKDWNRTADKGWRKRYIQECIDAHLKYQGILKEIKVLDPACGSGAFLNKAFDYLYSENVKIQKYINWLEFIKEDVTLEHQDIVEHGELLDIDKSILRNNLFGVDLNKESVEITKLSLWIKTANGQDTLTSLNKNILVGNSVIEEKSIVGDKAFDWSENFKSVFEQGGFDVIIGNPPYIPLELIEKEERKFLQKTYDDILKSKWDISAVFMRKSTDLLHEEGYVSLIVPITWQTGPNYFEFRKELFNNHLSLERLINLPYDVFPDAYVDTCILVASKNLENEVYLGHKYNNKNKVDSITILDKDMDQITTESYMNHHTFKIFTNNNAYNLYSKIEKQLEDNNKFKKLRDLSISTQGPVESKFTYYPHKNNDYCYPYLKDGQMYRYLAEINDTNFIDLGEKKHLIQYYIGSPKIFMRRIVNRQDRIIGCYVEEDLVTKKDLNPFMIKDHNFLPLYVLALMNSKLLSYIYINFSSIATKDDYRQTTLEELRELPIKVINKSAQHDIIGKVVTLIEKVSLFHSKREKVLHLLKTEYSLDKLPNKITEFYNHSFETLIFELKKKKKSLSLNQKEELLDFYEQKKEQLLSMKDQIMKLDSEVDSEIYSLYELSMEEIEVIEEHYSKFKNPSSLF
ncbi:Eco57I restriction-modification methylase domain-containing protein [Priestia megaterium]|uniref:Eco57I restriction-modification methylase domain-containing protein n=1 Tax=Priestia megaterium TaxID=1404 RepID=UPI001C218037|nr:DNA methyltransferase [Priestia megaterium]MBU8754123.1 N-6 DNA methylase [Priestia megaterium]